MKPKSNSSIDLAAVRDEIAAAHEQAARWEWSLDQLPTPHDRWTMLAEFAGPNLKNAMRTGIVHIEIPAEAASGSGLGKPQFVIEGEPVADPGKER